MRGIRVLLLVVLAGLTWSSVAQAAFPGQNGKIVFAGDHCCLYPPYSIYTSGNPGVSQLTTEDDATPAWSPDGERIAFTRRSEGRTDVWVMNADGSAQVRLTPDDPYDHGNPSWTPDGTQILWTSNESGTYDVWRMNADGTGRVKVGGSDTQNEYVPVMSPDGGRIAFQRFIPASPESSDSEIWLMDPDGTNEQLLGDGNWPDWSPDGTRIVFSRGAPIMAQGCFPDDEPYESQVEEIFRMNADGTGATRLTHSSAGVTRDVNSGPVWSPDGTRIAWWFHTTRVCFTSPDPDHVIRTMNPDGGQRANGPGPQALTPDWQPVQPGYPRPKSATLIRTSLVPAYIQCTSPNRDHGPPLAFPSCNPPQQRSGVLTAGTPDANGAVANLVGSLKLKVQPGSAPTAPDDADVAVAVSITDVRCRTTNAACPAGAGSDYEGRLLGVLTGLRISDRVNTPPGPVGGPGTAEGVLEMPVPCVATADAGVGSTCSLATTIDALLPGAVSEGRRAVWELGQIQVRDAGANGTGFESPACPPTCGDGDETLFLREGVFVP